MRYKYVREKHDLANKKVRLKSNNKDLNNQIFIIEDWCCNLSGALCKTCNAGNYACLNFAQRESQDKLPYDDKVIYGKIDGLGYIVHESEIGELLEGK